ncbi:16S rRNA (uracil(1498)-N(3))-methyltransferase [Streptococcus suis]|uniref:16S rRNA (uracil(1498)-N(3))-methyltransferase n=1 Tax=Streptococcus suis TaxID=1307 RepID=UPI001593E158|nr:16S rRNA (uracil(1498)-N(3))-methyltransferase [Streptococcus suis]MBL6562687.1 16S rRNA (uracil(1498)-N(3))-methyltransferase [Streptococcus suis]MBS0769175.1 16S rRNA (uracil(1498)-N(3))-methyltransferase [Streptococcus suis]MBS0771104.1 16S rRNA (uracil(1498)-N(3))-methyltransferase [Streptococcus suis]MCH1750691.1 16S rRNA (uracil(1498)-N(3))-methyltransferase [Streptococcus suis]NVH37887.1 16S rRNA (uracil(1498)-N(3))-methyltransferase [Streptococcus suis]
MQQYFINGRAPQGVFQISDKDTAKYMFSVMRLQADEQIVLVFDDGIKRLARVVDSQNQSVEIIEELSDNVELPVSVTIAMGFPKGDKLEFVAQKATELGMAALWAFPADWSVVKWDGKKLGKKAEKLEKIAQGAAEQSKRNRIPAVRLFEKKVDFLAQLAGFDQIILAYEEAAKEGEQANLVKILSGLEIGQSVLVIVGPEGGVSPEEVAAFEGAGAVKTGLGPRILRAETAPLYALSAISYATELLR